MKTSELTGAALDWAVAKADSHRVAWQSGGLYLVDEKQRRIAVWSPSTAWAQGGPIIEREGISIRQTKGHPAMAFFWRNDATFDHQMFAPEGEPLTAAMRCYVVSKLGDEIDVPEFL